MTSDPISKFVTAKFVEVAFVVVARVEMISVSPRSVVMLLSVVVPAKTDTARASAREFVK